MNLRPLLTAPVEYRKKRDVLFSAGTAYQQRVSALAGEPVHSIKAWDSL